MNTYLYNTFKSQDTVIVYRTEKKKKLRNCCPLGSNVLVPLMIESTAVGKPDFFLLFRHLCVCV